MSEPNHALPRNHEGQLGAWQDGHYFNQGQAQEMYRCPGRWVVWDYVIGVFSLDDGTFLAWHGLPDPYDDGSHWKGRKWGGSFIYNRRYVTREAALVSNAAYCIWFARKQHRLPKNGYYQGEKISDERYRQIVAWVFAVLGRRGVQPFIAPPPPPKREWKGERLGKVKRPRPIPPAPAPAPAAPIAAD